MESSITGDSSKFQGNMLLYSSNMLIFFSKIFLESVIIQLNLLYLHYCCTFITVLLSIQINIWGLQCIVTYG